MPNGIPRAGQFPRSLPSQPAIPDGFPLILYVGHLGYEPNIDAAGALARTILPRVRDRLPAAKLVLAGRSPAPPVRALVGLDGLSLVEDPHDIKPLLCADHLTIVPLAMGGGTRIKILEAMALGVPVIATPLAVEGLGLIEGEEVLLSGTDEGLAEMAVGFCSDRARMASLRARAHGAAWSRFGPQAIRDAVRHGLGLDSPVR